jgi:hypothetical protein
VEPRSPAPQPPTPARSRRTPHPASHRLRCGKAQAAAVKAVGGGTAGDVTTDYFGNGYEVTVTKSNGSKVEIHLDSSFHVMGPPGGHGGAPPPLTGWNN